MPRGCTDSALPWLWEQQLSSLLGSLTAHVAHSPPLTPYVMAFGPPPLYFIYFEVVYTGRKGGKSFHAQTEDALTDGKAFFHAERKEVAVKTHHAAPFGLNGTNQCQLQVQR